MAFTRPRAAQIDFDVTNISDPLIRLNSAETGSADKDVGLVIERGSDTNAAFLYDESADQFVLVNTTETGTTSGNVTISSYAGLQANAIIYGSLNDGTTTLTSTVAELNILDGVTSTATELNLLDGITGVTLDNAGDLLIVGSDGTSIDSSALLNIDTGNGRLGIGTSSPARTLHLVGDTQFEGSMRIDQYHTSSDGPDILFQKARGTPASTTAAADGDELIKIVGLVHDGTDFQTRVRILSDTVLDGGDYGANIQFQTGDGADPTTRFTIAEDGNITVADGTFDFDIAAHDGTNGLKLGGTLVTSSAAELNILDGVTATATELNHLDGVTGIALGNANELVIVDSDGTGFASSSTLSIDDGNNYIGINQTSPEVTLHMTGEGVQTAQIRMEQYNDSADAPDVRTRRYRGTVATPAAVQSGDYLFRSNHEYWNGTSLLVGGSFAFDNTNNAARTQFSVAVDTDGTGANPQGNNGQFKIDGNDSGAITFNNAYKFPTSDGSANQVLATDGSGALSFVDQSGGLSNIVEDTTPQLGGNLDTNSNNILIDDAHFIADENTNEQIVFQTTASAVNSFQITNAATGNAIELASVGGDTNIGMNLVTKGSGEITLDTLAVSDLTAGRIPYIGTSGAITDAANLAWNNTGGNDSNGLLTAQNITVNNRLAGGGTGFQFFAFNEDTVDVKFANWYSTSDHQYGMGMLYYETYFAALENTDVNLDQQRRFGFYLETPDNGASDTAGSASTQGTNYRLAITRDSLRLNNANPIRMYENNSGAVGTNYIELDWPASITSNAIINVPAVAGHLAVLGAAPTETITSTPAELNILDGVTATTAELNILDGVTSTATELNLLDGITGITLGSANETLIVDTDGNSITTTDLLAFDTGNNRVGIGTTSPATKFHIAGEGSANEGQIRLQQAYDGSDGPDFAFYASRGTIASPTSTANNDTQGRINAYVHNGTNFVQSGSFGWSSDGTDGDNTFDIRSRVGGTLASRIEVVASGDIEFQDGAFDVDVKSHDGTNGLKLGGTLVTASAAELNLVDGVSAGTVTASKAVIYDSNGGIVAGGDINLNDADDQIIHGDSSYKQKQYVLYGTTTDATETEIFVGGTANSRIPVPTDTTVFYEVDIAARRTDATGESGGWHLKAVADNFSDTVADVGDVYEVQVASDDANFAVDARADNTNDAIGIHVTGVASKTIRWVAIVRTFEVTE